MRPTLICAAALAIGLTASQAARIPQGSRERAERLQTWRAELEAAEDAVRQGRLDAAEEHYLRVVEPATEIEERGLLLARALDGLADLRRAQDRLAEAEQLYLESASLWRELLGPRQPRLAVTLHNLGTVQMSRGNCSAARESLEDALDLWKAGSEQAAMTRQALRVLDRECDLSERRKSERTR